MCYVLAIKNVQNIISVVISITDVYSVTEPSQQPPPTSVPESDTSLRLEWVGPDYPNGLVHTYDLYRDGQLIASVNGTPRELHTLWPRDTEKDQPLMHIFMY